MASEKIESVSPIYGSNSNGDFIKFPNGVLIQWGTRVGANGMTVTLPTAFNTIGYTVSMNAHYNNNTSIVCILSELDRTVSSFRINAWDANTRAASTSTNVAVLWIAIGTWK
jgi:hypothetical protein